MNENPRSNQEISVLFEQRFELEPSVIYMTLNTESVVDQTDQFADAFVCENVAYI